MNGYQDISELEKSVANAGSQLYTVAHKLHEVERSLDASGGGISGNGGVTEVDEIYVMELLESMTEVKNEYQNLRKDIAEVQQLQRDVTTSIRFQMRSMQQTFRMLKKRIEVQRNAKTAAAAAAAAAAASSMTTSAPVAATVSAAALSTARNCKSEMHHGC